MKRWYIILFVFLLIFLPACDVTVDLGGKSKFPLEASILSPTNGSQFEKESVDIQYRASAPEGVALVELSVDGNVISSNSPPDTSQNIVAFQYSWLPQLAGSHIIRVRVMDLGGEWSDYADVMVSISEPQVAEQQPQADEPEEPEEPEEPDVPESLIYDVTTDVKQFYYQNNGCGQKNITISAKVSDPDKVWSVVVFTRFWDKEGGGLSDFDTGHAMSEKSTGVYSITLEAVNIANYHEFDYAVFYYQLVATDKNTNNLGRTEVFKDVGYEICP